MNRKTLFYTGFFVVLAVGFYFVLTRVIPGFGQKTMQTGSYVRPFSFTNQDGKTITEKDLAGKVYVAEYFFTTCPGICLDMNNNMKLVYQAFKDEPDFLILSFTSDPETDSPGKLKKYADSLGVNTNKWMFLTGRKDSLYNTARVSYMIDDPENALRSIDDQFIHSQLWALVDREGNVIKEAYDGIRQAEVKKIIKDARKLLKQKPNK